MKTWLGALRVITLVVLVLTVTLGGAIYAVLRWPLPQTAGQITLPGLGSTVEVLRDASGVPQIYADTPHDLFMAQGFIHAQDRFYQMDVWRHTTAGRLSEMFGEATLEDDRFLRTMGWRQVAEAEYAALDEDSRALLDAYTTGVNAYLEGRSPLAVHNAYAVLALIGYQPAALEAWSPADSLAWAKAMSWDLGSNARDELMRVRLEQAIGAERAADLMPEPLAEFPVILPEPMFDARSPGQSLPAQSGGLGEGIGSNNWAISGARSESGHALLGNDPHLGIQMPSIWYLNGLHCRQVTAACPYDVSGFSFAGIPGVVVGHNQRIAWGVTNNYPDVQDLYIEHFDPSDATRVEVNGAFEPLTTRDEVIRIRGGGSETFTVRASRNGPLVETVWGPAIRAFEAQTPVGDVVLGEGYGLAMRWTALEPGRMFQALLELNRATGWDDFRDALRDWTVPSQNFVYADVEGNIGYQMPSHVPQRRAGDGSRPVPGWVDDYQWGEYLPFEALPYTLNPSLGYVVTANQPVLPAAEADRFVGAGFDEGFRAERITQLIEADPALSLDDLIAIQGDDYNPSAEDLVPLLTALALDEPKLAAAQEALRGWDYQMRLDSQPAAVYIAIFNALLTDVFRPGVPEEFWSRGSAPAFATLRTILAEPTSPWWGPDGRDVALTRAFRTGYADLEQRLGSNAAAWRFGALHTSTFAEATVGSSGIAPIEALFNRGPFPTSGWGGIVNATSANLGCYGRSEDPCQNPYAVTNVPSMRMVFDLGDWDAGRVIHTTGQSGHPLSPHYIDMADPWRLIETIPAPFSRGAVEAATVETLRLIP
ncbi:MAG TPA: penicillin acylase family protein [Anaerolineales bacterium]|nr:penicillin acylase family protein [Anaerolineales bacterium]